MANAGLAYRLPEHVRPSHYRLHVHVDPKRSRRYRGTVDVSITVDEPTRELALHACELDIRRVSIASPGGAELLPRVRLHEASETLRLSLPKALERGEHRLSIRFSGMLRRDLRGLYEARSGQHRYAVTQLEAADARRFFPCFDEPAFKATFELSVTTAVAHTVISNAPESSQEPAGQGKKTVHFAPTPKLSTYLLALAVGALQGSETVVCGRTPIRVWHAPGAAKLTGFALATASECLARLERYFDVPYPYGKLDLVAVPDFEIGAMENAGAVFFRETLLLLDEREAALPERKRAAEVICHELAHMWFGNLVTMAWWDDLWLNEAFATWIAFAIVDEWRPQWRMWNDFGHGRNAALELDSLSNTHAIYTEVRTPHEATENFDLITYEKGAAVVRMLERYLGRARFRAGVRSYIKAHRESNAVAADLWRHLQRAAGQPGIGTLVQSWVSQEGFPLVAVERVEVDGRPHVSLSQTRFLATGPQPHRSPLGLRWRIPMVLRAVPEDRPLGLGARGRREVRHLLSRRSERVPVPGKRACYYGNADQGGCFRTLHDSQTLMGLSTRLGSMTVPERAGLVTDTWALVHAGYAPLTDLLPLLMAFAGEANPDVLSGVAASLERVLDALAVSDRIALAGAVDAAFSPQLQRLGMRARRDDDDDARLLRAGLVDLLGRVVGSPEVRMRAAEQTARYLDNRRAVEANLAGTIVSVAAIDGDVGLFDRYLSASLSDKTPQQRRRFRMALADFNDPQAVARLHRLCLGAHIPTQDVALVLARQLANPGARQAAWAFIRGRWPQLRDRLTPMLVSRLISALPLLGPDQERDVMAFFRAHPVPTAKRALRQVRERFRLERAFRKRARSQFVLPTKP